METLVFCAEGQVEDHRKPEPIVEVTEILGIDGVPL